MSFGRGGQSGCGCAGAAEQIGKRQWPVSVCEQRVPGRLRAETVDDKIDEQPALRSQKPLRGIERVDCEIARRELLQDDIEAAGFNVRADKECRQFRYALAGKGGMAQDIAVVGAEPRVDRDIQRFAAVCQVPALHQGRLPVVQAVVVDEVVRAFGSSVPPDIAGRGGKDAAAGGQLSRDQARILQGCNPDRDVEAFLDRVDETVVQRQLNLQVGIGCHKVGNRGPDMQDAE